MNFRPYKERTPATPKGLMSAMVDAGGGVKHVAAFSGKSPTQIQAYTDPDAPDHAKIDFVCQCAAARPAAALVLADYFAARAGACVMPGQNCDGGFDNYIASSAEDVGKLTALVLREHAAGTLARHAASSKLIGDLDKALADLGAARFALVRAEQERAIGDWGREAPPEN